MNALETLLGVLRDVADPSGIAVGVVAWTVALVLAGAGLAKLRSPQRFARALADFGVVRRPSITAASAVALAEIAVAAGLVAPATLAVAAPVAVVMFAAFVFLVARSLARGERFPCGCFGGEEELSRRTLLRTAVLAVTAALLVGWTLGGAAPPPAGVASQLGLACAAASVLGIAAVAVQLPVLARLNAVWARGYRSIGSAG